jgi:site-specific recombinase
MRLDSVLNPSSNDKTFLTQMFQVAHKQYPDIISFMDALTLKLEKDVDFHQKFHLKILGVFQDLRFTNFLTTSGLMQENSVFFMLRSKIGNILLPEIEDDQTLTSVVNDLFYNSNYFKNFKIIPKDRWERFYKALFNKTEESDLKSLRKNLKNQLVESITILMDRIGGEFSDNEMIRYRPSGMYAQTPFYKLSIVIRNIIESPDNPFDQLETRQLIRNCKNYLNDILIQKDNKGISLKITVKINRITQELERLQSLIRNLNDLKNDNDLVVFFTNSTRAWPKYYSPKNWLRKQISSSVYLVTFLATYHNGKTGEKYITSTAKEYSKLFLTAWGGGLVVALCVFIKLWLGNIDNLSPFSRAFLYSINYALGFSVIYLTHMTLATKQPSMTASLIAHTLKRDEITKKIDYSEFSKLFARLSRSQFIAFQGNVLASFSLVIVLFYLFRHVFGWQILTFSQSFSFWSELAYFDKKILWYASIAGFFLFVSGLLSGLVINDLRYKNHPQRIYHHPLLKKFFNEKKRKSIATWFEKNYGGVVGNVAFGFMMGFAFLIGDFLNINFDIRHITFVAGNLALGIAGIGFTSIAFKTLITAIIATFAVGTFNFFVSFLLSLMLAMRSNNIRLYIIFPMLWTVTKDFFRNPYKFFFPPLIKRSASKKMED